MFIYKLQKSNFDNDVKQLNSLLSNRGHYAFKKAIKNVNSDLLTDFYSAIEKELLERLRSN